MQQPTKPAPETIRQARADSPKMRERDLAARLGISEADLVAAHCGAGVVRIESDANRLLTGLEAVGEVMALTRNDSAVHEKIGVYDKVVTGEAHALVLGEDIDLRVFPKLWAHGFAVEKRDGDDIRRSLQFFDAAGEAVHKVHLRPKSNLYAYQNLVGSLEFADQSQTVATVPAERPQAANDDSEATPEDLRRRWSRMTDVHQFFGMLRKLKLTRHQAVRIIGAEFAWQVDNEAVAAMMHHAVAGAIPIMCFVGSRGCIQIHSGPVHDVKPMGPWLNVMDPTFHLHLRTDRIAEVWAVRKPTRDGHVTSLEAYDEDRQMIIQFFGERQEGVAEREEWRFLVEHLPRIPQSTAA